MTGDIVSEVLLPGAVAVLAAILLTWLWTLDYEEIAGEMLSALKNDEGKTAIGLLWRRASGYWR